MYLAPDALREPASVLKKRGQIVEGFAKSPWKVVDVYGNEQKEPAIDNENIIKQIIYIYIYIFIFIFVGMSVWSKLLSLRPETKRQRDICVEL